MLNFLEKDKDITSYSSFRTRAIAKYFFEIKTFEDVLKLSEINDFCKNEELKMVFIWSGTNILFAFDYFEGVIIRNNLIWYKVENDIIEVNSWELVSKISRDLSENYNKKSFGAWLGLPWTVAWAVIWNAGCFGLEVKDIFISTKILELNSWEIFELNREEMNFKHRTSVLKTRENFFLVSAKFNINNSLIPDMDKIREVRLKQPKWLSCGSFFKNPVGNFAGKLIEDSDFKWYKIGGAFISHVHANFLMSDGTATFNDIIKLKEIVKNEVFEKFWISLEEEVRIII